MSGRVSQDSGRLAVIARGGVEIEIALGVPVGLGAAKPLAIHSGARSFGNASDLLRHFARLIMKDAEVGCFRPGPTLGAALEVLNRNAGAHVADARVLPGPRSTLSFDLGQHQVAVLLQPWRQVHG